MSAKVNQFCDNLRDRLNTIEARVNTAKANVQALPGQAEKAVREKLDETQKKVQNQKQRFEQSLADLRAQAQQKVTETKEAVNEWKTKREARKLNDRADRAAKYAADSIDYALFTIDQAEEAMLDAVVARIDADGVQPAPAAR